VERAEREKAKRTIEQLGAVKTSLRLDDVAGRYWTEVGQHHVGARDTERQLDYLVEFFGKDKLITDITGDDVARLVAWRRGHRSRPDSKTHTALISPYTVNDTTEQLRKLFTRCKALGVRFDHEPEWHKH
ncbi:MAG: integrase, partial [Rhizobiales bacterium]|nr:integrase [Hyphomicrobiales bacterium]